MDRIFSNEKIIKDLDIQLNDINVLKELEICLENFLKNPVFKKINWKEEAIKDKICKDRQKLSKINGFKYKIGYIVYRYTTLYKIIQLKNGLKKF